MMNPTNEILFGAFLGFFILIAAGVVYWMFYDDEVVDMKINFVNGSSIETVGSTTETLRSCIPVEEVSDVEESCDEYSCCCYSVCAGIVDRVSTDREVKPSGRKHWSEH